MNAENILRELFKVAVDAADPMLAVPVALPPRPEGRIVVVGAGKASARMAEAAETAWGPLTGLVITRYGFGRPTKGIEIAEAAHPVPDAAGQAATMRMLDLLDTLGGDDFVLSLISGGGSALLTAPAGDITLAEKQMLNDALLRSGAPIDQMNTVRKHLSRVKGGQLAARAAPARMLSLMISDVPGDDPAFIASGPTVGDDTSPADALGILEAYRITPVPSVRAVLDGGSGVLPVGHPDLTHCRNIVISAPSQSLAAAARAAAARGLDVEVLGDALEGEARDLARSQAKLAMDIQSGLKKPKLLISGGECTVSHRGGGTGGPNAEFALAAGIALKGAPGIHLIACDTDGVDGAADVAGAVVGPDFPQRAITAGVDPHEALDRSDSHGFFERIGGQVVTGPTLTNVNDFRAILIEPLR